MVDSARAHSRTNSARIAGRYVVESEIGKGGMGAVYAVIDTTQGARVALKQRGESTARAASMFEREYHTLRSLRHPRIIEVYDYGVDADGAYYTMELLDGQDLRAIAPLSYERACLYLRDVASSLALLHARNLLHRDLTPTNVRVTGDRRCKLIDFGVLASFGVPEVLAGTPPFTPPEALSGAALDQRADLFSLGALAYWVLTGTHAFPAKTFAALGELWQHSPSAPSKVLAKSHPRMKAIPPALDGLVQSLLNRDPMARPASAAEVIDRLTVIAELEPEAELLTAESYLGSAPSVGREQEHARLQQRLETTIEGTGSSMVIEADQGLGSSRLLGEIVLAAQLRGALSLVIDATLQRGAYGVVQELIARLLEIAPDLAYRTAGPYLAELCHISPELRARVSQRELHVGKRAPGELRMRVQMAALQWLHALTQARPVLLAIDNAQRLDETSAAVIAILAYQARDHRIMLLSVIKPDELNSAPHVLRNLSECSARMRLEPFNRAQVEQLLRGVFGDVPHVSRVTEQVYRATAGNPLSCMGLLRQLVQSDVIRRAGGAFILPRELDAAELPAVSEPHARTLSSLPEGQLKLAQALSVHRGLLPIELCLAIGSHERLDDVWEALEGLTHAGVVGRSGTQYSFVHDSLREHLQMQLDADRRKALHRQFGLALVPKDGSDVDAMLEAGFHLVQGGDEGRGADLLAEAGLLLGYDSDEMRAAILPLRAALDVYRKQRRPQHELVQLLGPLCNAAWYCDRSLAAEYGDEAIEGLSSQIGLTFAKKLRPFIGKQLSLYLGLGIAALRYTWRRGRNGIQGLREDIVMYFNCVLSLAGVNAVCLDSDSSEIYAAMLEHLTALGKNHAATISYRFAQLLAAGPRERIGETAAGCRELLQRLRHDKPIRDLPDDSKLMIVGGVLYELGILDSFRDGPQALEAAEALETTGPQLYSIVASQVRANYHACRGEIELADYYRDRVEMLALQAGSGWQAEVWGPSSAILANLLTNDIIGLKRCAKELDLLSAEIPSLAVHAEVAKGGCLFLDGDAEGAIHIWQAVVNTHAPRSFIGWGAVYGALARGYNALGNYAEAKRLCEQTLAQLSEEDLQYTAMYVVLHIERAIAEAGLGMVEQARQRILYLLEHHHETGGPLLLGAFHKTCALISVSDKDVLSALHHTTEMERYYRPTHNPALLQQCEALRRQIATLQRLSDHPMDVVPSEMSDSASASTSISALRAQDRTRRLEQVLSLIVKEAGGQSGYLFSLANDPIELLSSSSEMRPAEHVIDQIGRDLRAFGRARRRTTVDIAQVEATLTVGSSFERPIARPKSHDYHNVILSADGKVAVAVVAVLVDATAKPIDDALIRAVTGSLLRKGDLGDSLARKPSLSPQGELSAKP